MFETEEGASACLKESSHELDGRRIEPKLATPRAQRDDGNPKSKSGNSGTNRIFVTKLPIEMTIGNACFALLFIVLIHYFRRFARLLQGVWRSV